MKVGRRPKSPWGNRANGPPPDHSAEGMAQQVIGLVDQIEPLLAGRPPGVQYAVLAELLAIWLAGHIDPTSEELTAHARAELLTEHVDYVEKMIPVIAKGMGLPW
jgi:hypothetical protein